MAAQVIFAEQVTINAVDWTALGLVKGAVLTVDFDKLDRTAMGNTYKRVIGGLGEAGAAINMIDDVAAAGFDSILWPLLNTIVAAEFRLSSAAVSTSNPKFTGNVLIASFNLGGQVGELAMKNGLNFPFDGAVTRATS